MPQNPKRIVLLGATGSIGDSALKVIRKHPDKLRLVGLAARQNVKKLAEIAQEFGVAHVGLYKDEAWERAKRSGLFPPGTQFYAGSQGLSEMAALPDCEIVLVAVVGTRGLKPALSALDAGKDLAIANKEILVLAGRFIMEAARRNGCRILPVDSEHNAIFQCLQGIRSADVAKVILTASGGSFRDLPIEELAHVNLEQALQHPNWNMGPKVTLDSATMANKGLELIEASWLFDLGPDQIDVVIHPQSIVHSFVQCVEGSLLAQLSPPDMTFAVQHALLHPERSEGVCPPLDFSQCMTLDFRPPEERRYPCLGLARRALQQGGIAPGIFNAANEVAIDAFVRGAIHFIDIAKIIEKTLETSTNAEPDSLEEVLRLDALARQTAEGLIRKFR